MGSNCLVCISPCNSHLGNVMALKAGLCRMCFLWRSRMLILGYFSLKPVGARGLDRAALGNV